MRFAQGVGRCRCSTRAVHCRLLSTTCAHSAVVTTRSPFSESTRSRGGVPGLAPCPFLQNLAPASDPREQSSNPRNRHVVGLPRSPPGRRLERLNATASFVRWPINLRSDCANVVSTSPGSRFAASCSRRRCPGNAREPRGCRDSRANRSSPTGWSGLRRCLAGSRTAPSC